MRAIFASLIILVAAIPAWAQNQQDAANTISKMQSQLDLQQDQVTNVTPIIERYMDLFAQLQKSVSDGTINPSAVESQKQEMEAQETQELSQYLKPYQLSEWRDMQAQMDQQNGQSSGDDSDSGEYSNYPQSNAPAQ